MTLYDTTPTPHVDYDQSKVPEPIKRRANYVRTKYKGGDILEATAQNGEIAGIYAGEAKQLAERTQIRQDVVEDQFAELQRSNTNEAYWGAEIISANVDKFGHSHATLYDRLVSGDIFINIKNYYKGENLGSVLRQITKDNTHVYFPDGDYNLKEKVTITGVENVTFTFADGATLHDEANTLVKDEFGVDYRTRFGIHFINCKNIKLINARAGNDHITFANITNRVEKQKVNPLFNFEYCENVTINGLSLYGTVGSYITQKNADGTIYTEDTIRSSFVRFIHSENIEIDHPSLDDNSGGGEIFTAFKCKNITFTNPHHKQTPGATTWWSLGDFIQCDNIVIDKVFDVSSESTGNMFDVSGNNIVIGNVDCYYPNGTIVDTTHEWGMDSGATRDVTLRNINYVSPELDANVGSGLLSSVNSAAFLTDPESKILDETHEQRRLLVEKCSVKNSKLFISVKPFREVVVRDAYVEDVDNLNTLEKYPSTHGSYTCDYLFDNLEYVKINKTTETTLESFGRTVVKNSKLTLNNTPMRLVDRLALYSGIPNLHESKGEIVFENCIISDAVFRVGSNLEFNNCKLINCYFVTVDYHGIRPAIRFTNGTSLMFNNASTAPRPIFDFTSGGAYSLEFVDSNVGGEFLNNSGYAIINGVDKLLNFSLIRSKWALRSTTTSNPELYKQRPALFITNGNTIKIFIDGSDVKDKLLRVICSSDPASGKIEIDIRNSDLRRPNDGNEARSIISLQATGIGGASLNTVDTNLVYSQFRGTQATYFDTTVKSLGGSSRIYNVLEY